MRFVPGRKRTPAPSRGQGTASALLTRGEARAFDREERRPRGTRLVMRPEAVSLSAARRRPPGVRTGTRGPAARAATPGAAPPRPSGRAPGLLGHRTSRRSSPRNARSSTRPASGGVVLRSNVDRRGGRAARPGQRRVAGVRRHGDGDDVDQPSARLLDQARREDEARPAWDSTEVTAHAARPGGRGRGGRRARIEPCRSPPRVAPRAVLGRAELDGSRRRAVTRPRRRPGGRGCRRARAATPTRRQPPRAAGERLVASALTSGEDSRRLYAFRYMALVERITQDLTAAMKAQDAPRVGALRMAKAALKNREIEKRRRARRRGGRERAAGAREAARGLGLAVRQGGRDGARAEGARRDRRPARLPAAGGSDDEIERRSAQAIDGDGRRHRQGHGQGDEGGARGAAGRRASRSTARR